MPVVQSGAFVSADTGARFRLVSEPADAGNVRGTVVFVHGFAEEMNKSRRMVARTARLLASEGWRVVQRDLGGCGDSAGEFGAASWGAWIDDIAAELAQAPREGAVWLWCLRAGALLAPAVLQQHPRVNLLLWQPVLSGAQHLQQFLRLHAGARIVGYGKVEGDTAPAQLLRSGISVEVGGYALNPALAMGLERSIFDLPAEFAGHVVWFEVSGDEEPQIPAPASRAIERLRERHVAVEATALRGPRFWQTQEIEECERLRERTLVALHGVGASGRSADLRAQRLLHPSAAAANQAGSEAGVEEVITFSCQRALLWGILSRPPAGVAELPTAVLVVVGGPQYRVGSHRQFVQLARRLAAAGFCCLRFDYRGMGDSRGEPCNFESCGPDVDAALDALCKACPAATHVAVWGLCDAASAALMFTTSDARVAGIVAVNPWVRSDASLSAVRVKFYYAQRMVQRDFWTKLLRGGLDWRKSLAALISNVNGAAAHYYRKRSVHRHDESFQEKMAHGLANFAGRTLLILSGNDLTAKEFLQVTGASPAWKCLLADRKVSRVDLPEADHTFSRRAWSSAVEEHTIGWLRGLAQPATSRAGSDQDAVRDP